ncbi:MAG: hypothetical protein ACRD6W_09980 [Nitrososphaerales archaeon]
MILAGLLLLLPSSPLYSLITKGTTSSATTTPASVFRFAVSTTSSSTDNTSTIESLVGFGLIAVGAVLELFSLITDVPGSVPPAAAAESDTTPPTASPAPAAPPTTALGEKRK